jgi:hypothetical protein
MFFILSLNPSPGFASLKLRESEGGSDFETVYFIKGKR